jgi:pimeloyl-ACP methyl ester carboxylesterase
MDWKSQTIEGADGTGLFVRQAGDPNGPAIVFSDGVGCDGYMWRYVFPLFRRLGFRLVHWHYRGHGFSERAAIADRLRVVDHADDLACILDALEIESATLIGHSMGVQVCLETWHRHRARVAALMLVYGAPGRLLDTFGGDDILARLHPFLSAGVERYPTIVGTFWRHFIPSKASLMLGLATELNAAHIRPADFMPYLEQLSKMHPADFVAMMGEAGSHDARPYLPDVDVPTVVVAGGEDGFTPVRLSRAMAEAIPGAEFHLVQRGSHAGALEFPEPMLEALEAFSATHDLGPATPSR